MALKCVFVHEREKKGKAWRGEKMGASRDKTTDAVEECRSLDWADVLLVQFSPRRLPPFFQIFAGMLKGLNWSKEAEALGRRSATMRTNYFKFIIPFAIGCAFSFLTGVLDTLTVWMFYKSFSPLRHIFLLYFFSARNSSQNVCAVSTVQNVQLIQNIPAVIFGVGAILYFLKKKKRSFFSHFLKS